MNNREGDSEGYKAPRVDLSMSDFLVEGHLGDGSFSSVVLARMKSSQQLYAIKIVNKHLILRNRMVDYVKRERLLLDKLDYEGITKLLFTFQDSQSLFFGLEFCPGGDLYEQVQAKGKLSVDEARFYASEIVLVLEYLRGAQVVHRDMKPENLLIDQEGHLKLSDFGCAKSFLLTPASNEPASGPSLGGLGGKPARSTSFVGTAEYVSPEVLENKPLSYPADLWAFGCVLYQMLVGKPPFKGASEYLTFQLVTEGVFSFPEPSGEEGGSSEGGSDGIPPEAKDLIERLLVLDPGNRLGASSIEDLKSHGFFTGVVWEEVRAQKAPPFVPPSPPDADQEALNWEFSSLMRDTRGDHGKVVYEPSSSNDDGDSDSGC